MNSKYQLYYKQIGLNIAYFRKMKNMSQMTLAETVNLSRTHISNIEAPNMKTSISLESLFDIAEALDVPVKEFFDFRVIDRRGLTLKDG